MSKSNVDKIDLPVCHTKGNQPCFESLEIVPDDENHFLLVYSPGLIEGIAKGDQFILDPTDPKGFVVTRRSGNLCIWFYFKEAGTNKGPDGLRVRELVEEFGGVCDGGGNTHLVFSIQVSLGFAAIEKLMDSIVQDYPGSSWLYGNVYDPWNNFEPLNWWTSLNH